MIDPNNILLEIDISHYKEIYNEHIKRYHWSLYNNQGSSKYTQRLHTEYGPFSLVGTLYGQI